MVGQFEPLRAILANQNIQLTVVAAEKYVLEVERNTHANQINHGMCLLAERVPKALFMRAIQ